LAILKIIVSVLLGVVVSLLLFVSIVVITGSIRESIAGYIFNATLLSIMCISTLAFLVLWNVVKSKRVHFLHLVPVICFAVILVSWLWGRASADALAAVAATPPPETAPATAPAPQLPPIELPPLPDFVMVSAGSGHTAAIGADGSLWAWGANHWGQLGDGTEGGHMWRDSRANRLVPTRIGTDYDWATVAVGGARTAAIKTDGSLWAWGNNANNHLGDGHGGHNASRNVPTRIGEDYDWASVALGDGHTAALKTDGTLWMWGSKGEAANGQLGGASPIVYGSVPTQLGTDSDWVSVTANGTYTALIKADGTLWAWGGGHFFFFVVDDDGEDYIDIEGPVSIRGTSIDINQRAPAQVGTEAHWVSASNSERHLFAVAADGSLWTWDPAAPNRGNHWETARRIGADYDWAAVSAGGFMTTGDRDVFTLAVKTDGSLWALGRKFSAVPGVSVTFFDYAEPTRIGTAEDWVFVSAGFDHSAGIRADGSLWAWGGNRSGQLGNGASGMEHFIRRSPIQIGTETNWTSVSTSATHTAALRADGSLWAWGSLGRLAFADGATGIRNRPARVGTDADWVAVSSGDGFSIATRTDGSVWTWGWVGQREGGEFIFYTVPTRIGADTGWASIATGQAHSAGVRTDGSLWSWGANHWGQLGRFTPTNQTHLYHAPARIGEDDDWATVFSTQGHNLAVRRDGSLWAWGNNENGQLGIGTISGQFDLRITPLRAGAEYDWAGAVISLSRRRSAAVKADGTLWAWGDGSFFGRSGHRSPARVGTDSDWVSVSIGGTIFGTGGHSVAIKRDGSLWAWGDNNVGQLGDGTARNRTAPTRIGSSYLWAYASAGDLHTVAVKTDGTLWAWGWNLGGRLGDGTEDDLAPQRVGR